MSAHANPSRQRQAVEALPGDVAGDASQLNLVELGRLVRRHGVRGEIRLRPHNPDSATLSPGQRVALLGESTAVEWASISTLRPHKNLLLLRFDGVDTAEAADLLIGRRLAVPREQLPALAEDEIYHCDLIGCAVATEEGEELGVVHEILPTGGNDVLVVRAGRREYLIPWIDDVVTEVDVAAKRVAIRPIPGLLDP